MTRAFRVHRGMFTKQHKTLAAVCEATGGHVVTVEHWPVRDKPRRNRPPHAWRLCERCGTRVCVYGDGVDGAYELIRVMHKGKQVAGPKGPFERLEPDDDVEVPEAEDVITASGVQYGKKGAA